MSRLTEECWRNLDPWECCGQDKYCQRGCHDEGGCTNGCKVPKLYIKLAKYEDLEEQCVKDNLFGLHELCEKWKAFFEDIVELLDYRKKKEEGLLIELPCKIGDDVFVIPSEVNYKLNKSFGAKGLNAVCRQVVDHIEFNSYGYWISTCDGMQGHRQESFNKTWFLTKAKAEEALAKMGGK